MIDFVCNPSIILAGTSINEEITFSYICPNPMRFVQTELVVFRIEYSLQDNAAMFTTNCRCFSVVDSATD